MSTNKKAVELIDNLLTQLFEAALDSRGAPNISEKLRQLREEQRRQSDADAHAGCTNCPTKKYLSSPMRLVQIIASCDDNNQYRYDVIVQEDVIVYIDEITHEARTIVESCENVVDLSDILDKDDGGLPVILPGVASQTKPGESHLRIDGSEGLHCFNAAAGLMLELIPDIKRLLGNHRMIKGVFNAVATVAEDGTVHLTKATRIVH